MKPGQRCSHRWRIRPIVILCVVLSAVAVRRAPAEIPWESVEYVSPVPGSSLVSPWNNVIIRYGPVVDPASLDAAGLSVVGSVSGSHAGTMVLADDSRALVFKPAVPFTPGERVHVALERVARDASGAFLPGFSFRFTVADAAPGTQEPYPPDLAAELPGAEPERDMTARSSWDGWAVPHEPPATSTLECDQLPPGFPAVTITTLDDPDPGCVFLAPYGYSPPVGHLLILDRHGEPVFYRPLSSFATDFKLQPYGTLTYYHAARYRELDSTYTEVDTWRPGNGYIPDTHGMQLLPNGHALLMSYDAQRIDMSRIVPGGSPIATVVGLIIQELDPWKNVVFQWRSWDHFRITDAADFVDLTAWRVDYVHGNSIELDFDGHLLLSSRHLNEVTKISRTSGRILWRMGPHARENEFTFENDPRGFQAQHDARRLPNGNITIFDNGTYLDPEYSSAVEYRIDEPGRTATRIWDYRHDPDVFAATLGNVQRRASGGTMIGWGGVTEGPRITDLNPDGSVGFELELGASARTYRAFRFPWVTTRFTPSPAELDFGTVPVGASVSMELTVENTSQTPVTISCFKSTNPEFSVAADVPRMLAPGERMTATVTFTPVQTGGREGRVYVRSVTDELIARSVEVRGTAGDVLAATGRPASFRLHGSRPHPIRAHADIRFELPRRSRVTLEVFDIMGRSVAVLVDGPRTAGSHDVAWDTRGMSRGLYFCRLRAGNLEARTRFVLVD